MLEPIKFGAAQRGHDFGLYFLHQWDDLAVGFLAGVGELEDGPAPMIGSVSRVISPEFKSFETARLTRTLSIAVWTTTALALMAPCWPRTAMVRHSGADNLKRAP